MVLARRKRSSHSLDSGEGDCVSFPRHICPPSPGLSSMTQMLEDSSLAAQAAAIPAGPPPTITRSNVASFLIIGPNVHPIETDNLATSRVQQLVNRYPAFETDPHSAQWPARLSANRMPE